MFIVNKNNLKDYDFDLDQDLKDFCVTNFSEKKKRTKKILIYLFQICLIYYPILIQVYTLFLIDS